MTEERGTYNLEYPTIQLKQDAEVLASICNSGLVEFARIILNAAYLLSLLDHVDEALWAST